MGVAERPAAGGAGNVIPVWLWFLAIGMSAWTAITLAIIFFFNGAVRLRKRYEPRVRRSTYGRREQA